VLVSYFPQSLLNFGVGGILSGNRAMMAMQLLAGAVLKRLLVSLAIFAVGFVSVCAWFRVPSEDWFIAMLGALPWCVALIFVLVSVTWFVADRLRSRQRKNKGAD
jgi:hypothetical protein